MSETNPVDHDLVLSVIDQVWDTLLQAPAMAWLGSEPTGSEGLHAQIALTGDWNGTVRLTCDPATAERIAVRMLSIAEDEELFPEDVHDAVGEIVNVVGGNFKGALGGETSLGLPVVEHGLPGPSEEAMRCVLDWEGSPVVVEILPDAVPAVA